MKTFLRNHREKLLAVLAIAGATLIINSDRLFRDTRPLRWSKEYAISGARRDFETVSDQIRDETYHAMRGTWSDAAHSRRWIIKVELRGEKP